MKTTDLTKEEKATIQSAARAVWDYVGADCLRGLEEAGERRNYCTRAEVVEIVIDADRLDNQLRSIKQSELAKKFEALSYEQKKAIVRGGFVSGRYGW